VTQVHHPGQRRPTELRGVRDGSQASKVLTSTVFAMEGGGGSKPACPVSRVFCYRDSLSNYKTVSLKSGLFFGLRFSSVDGPKGSVGWPSWPIQPAALFPAAGEALASKDPIGRLSPWRNSPLLFKRTLQDEALEEESRRVRRPLPPPGPPQFDLCGEDFLPTEKNWFKMHSLISLATFRAKGPL